MAQFFPEPLNAITAVFFLAIAIFWTLKIKDHFKEYPFLTYCLVLLYSGAIGGTVYHSFRQWYLIYTHWKAVKWVRFAVLSFVFALTFRIVDKWEWLSFGTHFLWHTFGAVATFCMFNYIYLTRNVIRKM